MVVFRERSRTKREETTLKMGLTILEIGICKTAQSRVRATGATYAGFLLGL